MKLHVHLASRQCGAAMRTFLEEGVDVAIMEVGLGGRLDATNCVRSPVVCGVTALGFDHMDVLGHTLPVSHMYRCSSAVLQCL